MTAAQQRKVQRVVHLAAALLLVALWVPKTPVRRPSGCRVSFASDR
jgi:hypothetical protein